MKVCRRGDHESEVVCKLFTNSKVITTFLHIQSYYKPVVKNLINITENGLAFYKPDLHNTVD